MIGEDKPRGLSLGRTLAFFTLQPAAAAPRGCGQAVFGIPRCCGLWGICGRCEEGQGQVAFMVSPEVRAGCLLVHGGSPLLAEVGIAVDLVAQNPSSLACTRCRGEWPGGAVGQGPPPVPFLGSEQDWSHIPVHPPGAEATTMALFRVGGGWRSLGRG